MRAWLAVRNLFMCINLKVVCAAEWHMLVSLFSFYNVQGEGQDQLVFPLKGVSNRTENFTTHLRIFHLLQVAI